jgi:hypothetical protein
MSDPLDISDLVEALPDAKAQAGFLRVCVELGVEPEDFDMDDPDHYAAFELELKTLAVNQFVEGFIHDLISTGAVSIEDVAVNEFGELRLTGDAAEALVSACAG